MQFLTQHQRQKTAEHMAADRLVMVMILAVSVLSQVGSSFALEVDRRRIEEDQFQFAEQIATAVEQGFLKGVFRILKQANRLDRKWQKTSKKGTGFVQPLAPHKHWHVDISYLNLGGTFYYLCSLLDGYSRFIVHYNEARLHSAIG